MSALLRRMMGVPNRAPQHPSNVPPQTHPGTTHQVVKPGPLGGPINSHPQPYQKPNGPAPHQPAKTVDNTPKTKAKAKAAAASPKAKALAAGAPPKGPNKPTNVSVGGADYPHQNPHQNPLSGKSNNMAHRAGAGQYNQHKKGM